MQFPTRYGYACKIDTAEPFSRIFYAAESEQGIEKQHVLEAEAQVEWLDCHARITSEETCNNSFCEKWHPLECLFYKTKSGCRFWGKSALTHTARLTNSLARSLKRMVTELQWLYWKNTRQLDCVFQDMEPPRSPSIVRKSSAISKPIQRVRFTKNRIAFCQHSRHQIVAWSNFCPGDPHQRNPNAPKI